MRNVSPKKKQLDYDKKCPNGLAASKEGYSHARREEGKESWVTFHGVSWQLYYQTSKEESWEEGKDTYVTFNRRPMGF